MDGLTLTCGTCRAKLFSEDIGNHVCSKAQPLYPGRYEDRRPRRSDEMSRRELSSGRSEANPNMNRAQYPPRKPVGGYREDGTALKDDTSLNPHFDLGSIRAPHSYDGPYGAAVGRTSSQGVSGPPRQFAQQPGPRPSMQRQPYDAPAPRQNPPYYQPGSQGAPRPQYTDDFDYSRPKNPPPPRLNMLPDNRYPNRSQPHNDPPMHSPLFNRMNNDRFPERSREDRRSPERRVSPDHRYPEPRFDERFQSYGDQSYGDQTYGNRFNSRSDNPYDQDYDRPESRRNNSPPRDQYHQSDSNRSLRESPPNPPGEETEIWRQIRNRVQQKSASISSSRSSNSDTSRSQRSDNTPPSSAGSPVSPSKSATDSEKETFEKIDHDCRPSDSTARVFLPTCRACNEPIRGRSLASQDGKLTGRYHKRCFCCTTCQKPFETATFYVLQDRPYCKRHYHELNNSMCAECGDGVEGQCLQLEDATIRHPICFTCNTCHTQLNEDYFELNGRPYCERHARLLGKKDMRMERRKTRLLMM